MEKRAVFWRTGTLLVLLGLLIAPAAAQTPASRPPPPWVGMWSGRSISSQKLLDDPVRKLSRSSEGDFWFVIDANGQVKGEGFVTYSADLKAMKWKVPIPTGGNIDAEVAGSSGKIIKRIGIGGQLNDSPGRRHDRDHADCSFTLALQAVGQGEDGQPAPETNSTIPGVTFDFKIEASVNVPAGAGSGAVAGAAAMPGAAPSLQVISVPAKGWSPFQSFTPKVERGPGEPMRVMVEDKGEKHYILWYAVQQSVR